MTCRCITYCGQGTRLLFTLLTCEVVCRIMCMLARALDLREHTLDPSGGEGLSLHNRCADSYQNPRLSHTQLIDFQRVSLDNRLNLNTLTVSKMNI